MSMTLSQVVDEYLTSNGIKKEFFASYIGCGSSKCALWFKGERKLTEEQLQFSVSYFLYHLSLHEFLSGKHVKTVADIMKEE